MASDASGPRTAGIALRVVGWACVASVPVVLAFAALAPEAVVRAVTDGGVTCLFRALTAVPCPFCNMTHATVALGRGELAAAHDYHPLVIPVLVLWMWAGFQIARDRPTAWLRHPRAIGVLCLAVAAIWAANLISYYS